MEGKAGRLARSMRVEHVLRECSYECNMMSSPFYLSPSRSLRRREEKGCVCSATAAAEAEAEWEEEAARGQTDSV